ncbi:MAG: hypothetical protein V3U65_14835 [Granulosicoccaceae bacterium]
MSIRNAAVAMLMAAFLGGCATGKSVGDADEIRDTGKANIVVLTYDLKAYATTKYSSVKSTSLNFVCPDKSILGGACFSIKLPYLGQKTVGEFALHAFEKSGAKVMKMKYGSRAVTGVGHTVVVDKEPRVTCFYNKKKKRDVCSTTIDETTEKHRVTFEQAAPLNVTAGSGCYLGHMTLTMIDDSISEYEMILGEELSPEKLTNISDNISGVVQSFVNRPCY